jgi:hypothetical protein
MELMLKLGKDKKIHKIVEQAKVIIASQGSHLKSIFLKSKLAKGIFPFCMCFVVSLV